MIELVASNWWDNQITYALIYFPSVQGEHQEAFQSCSHGCVIRVTSKMTLGRKTGFAGIIHTEPTDQMSEDLEYRIPLEDIADFTKPFHFAVCWTVEVKYWQMFFSFIIDPSQFRAPQTQETVITLTVWEQRLSYSEEVHFPLCSDALWANGSGEYLKHAGSRCLSGELGSIS